MTDNLVGRPKSVLFVCTMNAIRSPIAEALTRKYFPGIYVASAGVVRGQPDPFANQIIAEERIGFSHNPRELDELADGFFDLIVTLTELAHLTVLKKMQSYAIDIEYWVTPDPTLVEGSRDKMLQAYRSVADTLRQKITARFQ